MAKTRQHTTQRLTHLRAAAEAAMRILDNLNRPMPDHTHERQLDQLLTEAWVIATLTDKIIHDLVEIARADGATWSQVGFAFGTTKQAAFNRFSPSHHRGPRQ